LTNLSLTASYALRALSCLDGPEGKYCRAQDLAAHTGIPAPYLAKLLQSLHKGGIVMGHRGRGGGFKLAQAPGAIYLGTVVALVDGSDATASCLLGLGMCTGRPGCPARACCHEIREKVALELGRLTIKDLSTFRDGQP